MIRVLPGRDGFAELSRGLSVVPVYCSILSDQLTPVSAFERVAAEAEHAFPLESVVGGEKIARYSFLGAGPFSLVEADDRQTIVTDPNGRQMYENVDPLAQLEAPLAKCRAPHPAGTVPSPSPVHTVETGNGVRMPIAPATWAC